MTDEELRLAIRDFKEIIEDCASHFGVTKDEILGRSKFKNVVAARHKAWLRLQKRGYASHEIAAYWKVHMATVKAVLV